MYFREMFSGWEVDEMGSESYPIAAFGFSWG
jgi:hypothetical protein